MMSGSSRPNVGGSFPVNRSRGAHRRQESVATPQSPIDQVTDALNRLSADADGLTEIIAELSKVHKHMTTLLGRVAGNFPKLSPDEIRGRDLGRRVGDLKDKKIGGLGGDLEAVVNSQKDIWQALIQLTQNIDNMLSQAGPDDDNTKAEE